MSDAFGPPVAGPSTAPMETIDEDDDEVQTTWSKGKGNAKEKSVGPQPSAVPTMEHPNLSTAGLEDDQVNQMNAMVCALQYHCNTGKYKRQRKAMEEAINPQTADVDLYCWSKNATIMFRPTFRLWWVPMLYRKMVKTC